MGEAAKKMCMRASQEDQPCPEKSTTLLKPYSFEAPTKLFRSATSSFQVWQKPSGNDAEENNNNNNNPQLDLGFKLDISNNTLFAPVANNHNNTVENPPIDQAEKTIINGSFATLGAGVNVNTGLISEGQEGQPSCLDLINLAIEDDEESKRMQKYILINYYVFFYVKLKILWFKLMIYLLFCVCVGLWQIEVIQGNTE